jgi:hypothetical protein
LNNLFFIFLFIIFVIIRNIIAAKSQPGVRKRKAKTILSASEMTEGKAPFPLEDIEEDDDGSNFSAYAASAEVKSDIPRAVPHPPARLFSGEAPSLAGGPAFPVQEVPGPPEASSQPGQERYRIPAAGTESPKAAPGTALPQKLNSLPPLKRAVVWAEILGPPKGF